MYNRSFGSSDAVTSGDMLPGFTSDSSGQHMCGWSSLGLTSHASEAPTVSFSSVRAVQLPTKTNRLSQQLPATPLIPSLLQDLRPPSTSHLPDLELSTPTGQFQDSLNVLNLSDKPESQHQPAGPNNNTTGYGYS